MRDRDAPLPFSPCFSQRARRNATRKHAEQKKKNGIKAAGNKKEREFTVVLKRWATGELLRGACFSALLNTLLLGGVGHAGERATVSANARRLLGRFAKVKVKSEKKPVKWVINSWDYVGAAPRTKKPVAEKKKPAAGAAAKKPAADKKAAEKK